MNPKRIISRDGEMVDTSDLKSDALWRGGSNPPPGTSKQEAYRHVAKHSINPGWVFAWGSVYGSVRVLRTFMGSPLARKVHQIRGICLSDMWRKTL